MLASNWPLLIHAVCAQGHEAQIAAAIELAEGFKASLMAALAEAKVADWLEPTRIFAVDRFTGLA